MELKIMKKSQILIFISLGFLSLSAMAQSADIDKYVASLAYDPRKLLALTPPNSLETVPPRVANGGAVTLCSSSVKDINENLSELTLFTPTAGVIYPGALVLANPMLVAGTPTPVGLARKELTLSLSLPGSGQASKIMVANPNNGTVSAKIDEHVEKWFSAPATRGYVNPANSSLKISKASSSTQMMAELNVQASFGNSDVKTAFAVNDKKNSSSFVGIYRQKYYSVTADTPTSASQFFAPSVQLAQLKQVSNNENPLAYVRSVDYGRLIVVRMDTSSSALDVDIKAAFEYATTASSVDASANAKYKEIISQSTFKVFVVGGGADVSSVLFDSKNINKLPKVIADGSVLTRKNPAVPVSYTVAFAKDNSLAALGLTTKYTVKECTHYKAAFVKVRTSGAYVARFAIKWSEATDKPGVRADKEWLSGQVTTSFEHKQNLPGDAQNVRILGQGATGLLWEPWRTPLDVREPGPTNRCYTIGGTTLNQWPSVKDGDVCG
jgi:thiol-activated cytolysin